ncbi:MAG: alpha/beta hydrolase [Streptococcaceae bacterium]|jgi:acetyl esterase/lipase|nr:alpha/beta hydrolase [Streptococcaceae bacterium]
MKHNIFQTYDKNPDKFADFQAPNDLPYPIPEDLSNRAKARLSQPTRHMDYPAPDDAKTWGMLKAMTGQALAAFYDDFDFPIDEKLETIAGVPTYVLHDSEVTVTDETPLYIDVHGGALVFGQGEAAATMAKPTAILTGYLVWAPDYRMPPESPFPAGLDDVFALYQEALKTRPASKIVVGGQSAGGNLAAALVLKLKAEGLPLPGALVLDMPELDLAETGDSFATLKLAAANSLETLLAVNRIYAVEHDLKDPLISPLYGDMTDFPPTFLHSGTRDLFLSNTVRIHAKLTEADVDARLFVSEATPHGWFGGAPEDDQYLNALGKFLSEKIND